MKFKSYPKYKNSGVEWLGEVPIGWDIKKVKYLFEIRKRIAGKEGYPVLSITQRGIKVKDTISGEGQLAMDYSKYQFVEFGDFAMNHMDLLTGYVDISNFHGVTSPDYRVFALTDTNSVDRYFLYLMQMGYKNKIFFSYGQGIANIGRWRLQTDSFNNFSVPYPNKKEQQIIVNFLDRETRRIDVLVEEKNCFIELLKEKRQALISYAVTKGLNPTVKMRDSGIEWFGEVPETWKKIALRRALSMKLTNGIFKTKDKFGEGRLLVNVFDIYRNDFRVSPLNLDRVDCTKKEQETYEVKKNDLFFVRSSLKYEGIAAVAIVEDIIEPMVFECHLIRARPKNTLMHGRFASYLLNSELYRAKLISSAKITTMTTIDQDAILSLRICLPSISEQAEIANYLDRETFKIDTLIKESQYSIQLLKEHRSVLISAAVTGKIDVREAA